MKRVLSFILVLCVMLSAFAAPVNAQTPDTDSNEKIVSRTVEMLDDGYLLETVVTEEITEVAARANEYVRAGSVTRNLKNSDGDVLCNFTLRGQYDVVEGVSSVCTLAKYSYNIYDSSWSLDSASTSKSANKAIGNATFKKKVLFITTDTKSFTLTLTCDKYGNLS